MLLREILDIEEIKILSEGKTKGGDTINIRVPFCKVDKKTKNSRIYSEWLMKRELGKVQKAVESGSFLGQSDHPESGLGTVKDTSHIVEKLELDEEGIGWADLKILSTEKGRTIQTIIRENGRLGISMRGMGTVSRDGQVQGDYSFLGLDICLNPSVENAMFDKSNIVESVNFQEPNVPSEETIKFIQSKVYDQGKESGSKQTFQEFLKEHGTAIEASVLVEQGIYPNIETALVKMGKEDVLREMKSEEKVKVWDETELFWEARTAGVSPSDLCKKLNENEQRKKIDRNSGFSKEVAANLIAEAESAGVTDLKDPEKRKQFFEKMKETVSPSELTIHERAVLVDKKINEGKESNIPFIEEVLRHKDKEEAIKKRQRSIAEQIDREMTQSGAHLSREEYKRLVNREFKRAGLPKLTEDE